MRYIVECRQHKHDNQSYDDGSKRHSLQAVELSQRTQAAVQIVSNLPAPAMEARFTVFGACGPAGWLALLLTNAGDVETNPGPTTLNKKVWICDICHKQIHVRNDLRKGDLFVLSWARVRRVRRGSISSELLVCGGGVRSILLLPLVARCLETIDVCIWRMFVFMSVVVTVWGSVGKFVV